LFIFFRLTTWFASLRGRVSSFLKKRLIRSCEGKLLPAIAARNRNISGHGSPRVVIVQPDGMNSRKEFHLI
jgi:hypothetical protein